jgi:outer membrane protein assembly factor BamB
MQSSVIQFVAAAWLLLEATAFSQEWTRFRGPNGTGLSNAKTIPTTWTEKDVNWKTALPGSGHSSPVVWDDKIFLTSGDDRGGQMHLLALRTTDGSKLWQKEIPFEAYTKHTYNTFASGSPTVDSERVYFYWTTPTRCSVAAFKHDGTKVWEKDLGAFVSQHGGGTSPILYQDKLILANEQDGESFLIALDSKTGDTKWKTPRKTVETAFSTPMVYEPKGDKAELIFNSHAHGICAVDSDTGKEIWDYPKAFDKRSVSSPVLAGDLLIGSCGSGGGGNYVVAIHPGSSTKKPEQAFKISRSAPYVPTSVCVGEKLFLWSDSGIVTCLQLPTGEIKWQERVGGDFFSSPVCVAGRLFCVSTRGEVVVLDTSDKFQVLARNPLGELTHSTPAIAGGRMYIHTATHLVSIGGRELAHAKP